MSCDVVTCRHGSPAPNRMARSGSGSGNSAPVPGPSSANAGSRGAWTGMNDVA